MAKRRTKKVKKIQKTIAFVLVILIFAFVLACYFHPPLYAFILGLFDLKDSKPEYRVDGDTTYIVNGEMPDLKMHFVDVGQGDSIIIELPDGKNVIIDAGEESEYDKLHDYIEENTSIERFDYAIATHADSDHIGAFDKILADYEVKMIYRPHVYYSGSKYNFSSSFNKGGNDAKKSTVNYGDFLKAVQDETYLEDGSSKSASWEFFTHESDFAGKISYQNEIYEYYFDFLTPRVESYSQINFSNANDYSPIIKFTYEDVDVLLTGDAEGGNEGDGEDIFVEQYKALSGYELDVDVLKVGHHGSRTSTTQALLDLVRPEYAVIQCGFGNSYKHPHQESLDRLFELGCVLYRNDLHGNVVLVINSEGEFNFNVNIPNPNNVFVGGDA